MDDGKQVCGLLNLTVRCNQNCLFCCDGDVKGSGYHLTTEEAKAKIEEIAAQGASSITFIGGEPLVRRNLAEFVGHARALNLRVGLTTNGTMLTRDHLDELVAAGLTSVEVSIHSFDPALADVITRGKKTAERQRAALDNLARHPEVGLSINFVVFSMNYKELPSFATSVASDYPFADEFFINFLDPIGYPAHDHSLLPHYRDVQPLLMDALDTVREAGISFTVDSVPGCILGPYFLFLRATREKLRGVLYAKKTLRIRDSGPDPDLSQYYRVNSCFDCPVSGLCPGVNFRYLAIRGQSEFSPYPAALIESGDYHVPREAPDSLPGQLLSAVEQRRAHSRVVSIPIENRCNNRCDWCPCRVSAARTDCSPSAVAGRLTRVLDEPDDATLLFSGGEPTLNPALFKLVRRVVRSGRRAGFTTNGRVFAYEKWARRAGEAGTSLVRLSLPAPIGAIDSCAGAEGAEGQTLAGLDNLLGQRRFLIEAELAIPKGTDHLVAQTTDYLEQRGIRTIRKVPQK